jgi:hypothetical protein
LESNLQAFRHIFPSLLWLVRDFHLDLSELDDSPTNYLYDCLRPLPNDGTPQTSSKNMTREIIPKMFASLNCMTISHPGVPPSKMKRIDQLPFEELSQDFREDCDKVVRHLLATVPTKLIMNPSLPTDPSAALSVTSETLPTYCELICDSFNSGVIPPLDDMFENTSQRACATAVERAKATCIERMTEHEKMSSHASNVNLMTKKGGSFVVPLSHLIQPLSEGEANQAAHKIRCETIETFSSLAMGPALKSSQKQLEEWLTIKIRSFQEDNAAQSKRLMEQVSSALLIHLKNQTDLFVSFEEYGLTLDGLIEAFHEINTNTGKNLTACVDITREFLKESELLRDQVKLKFRLEEAKREAEENAKRVAEEQAKAAKAKMEADRRLAEQNARAAQVKREADQRLAEEQKRRLEEKKEAEQRLEEQRRAAAAAQANLLARITALENDSDSDSCTCS